MQIEQDLDFPKKNNDFSIAKLLVVKNLLWTVIFWCEWRVSSFYITFSKGASGGWSLQRPSRSASWQCWRRSSTSSRVSILLTSFVIESFHGIGTSKTTWTSHARFRHRIFFQKSFPGPEGKILQNFDFRGCFFHLHRHLHRDWEFGFWSFILLGMMSHWSWHGSHWRKSVVLPSCSSACLHIHYSDRHLFCRKKKIIRENKSIKIELTFLRKMSINSAIYERRDFRFSFTIK